MGKTLSKLAEDLVGKSSWPVQLIYALNGVGKTRLSREFSKSFTSAEVVGEDQWEDEVETFYYNAFTEDLFQWDNDPHGYYMTPRLLVQNNTFIEKCVGKDGKEGEIVRHFQRYIGGKKINAEFSFGEESFVSFSIGTGDKLIKDIKISRGEESCFVWSLFYTFLKGVIDDKLDDNKAYPKLKYIFIDDPVSSLDENHVVEVAVDIAELIKKALEPEKDLKSSSKKPSRQKKASKSSTCGLKWVISTHNNLFYNVIYNSLDKIQVGDEKAKAFRSYVLIREEDNTYELKSRKRDVPFLYHRHLLHEIEAALKTNSVQKCHFSYLRYILEKTSVFLGITPWSQLLPQDESSNYISQTSRYINLFTHGMAQIEEANTVPTEHINRLKVIIDHLKNKYHIKGES